MLLRLGELWWEKRKSPASLHRGKGGKEGRERGCPPGRTLISVQPLWVLPWNVLFRRKTVKISEAKRQYIFLPEDLLLTCPQNCL